MKMSLLIKNGNVVNPGGESGKLDILIEDGKIRRMEAGIDGKADREIDAAGCMVMPGFVDVHVHFRDPGQTWKEDIISGAEAAKHGGYTSVVMMASPQVSSASFSMTYWGLITSPSSA